MPELSPDDIALGRAALSQGAITRPQLDAAVHLVRGGQAADLARALLRGGALNVRRLEELRGGGAPAAVASPPRPLSPDDAMTLHDEGGADGEVTLEVPTAGVGLGGFAPPGGSAFGPPGGRAATSGFGSASGAGAFGSHAGSGVAGPGASAFGPPGGRAAPAGFGPPLAGPGASAFGPGPGGGFGPPGGSGFGPPPAFGETPTIVGGRAPAASPRTGPGATSAGFAPVGPGPGSGFGPPGQAGGFGPPGGSGFGPPPGAGAFGESPTIVGGMAPGRAGPGATGFGPPPGAPGATGFGPPPGAPGATGFGPPATGFGPPPGAPGATGFGPPATGFGAPPSGPGATGFGPGASAGAGEGSVADEQVGPWKIEREIARGGMGAIYLGRHEQSGERAAVKVMLLSDGSASQKKVKRFLREIDANRKLEHPGIVRILDSGEFNGYPYFAMEFIEGKPLDRMLKDDLDLEIGMEILEAMCRAVHYAHEQGIVHRDLKPANVIVQEDMTPKLTDFGLAKDSDNQSVLTKTGAVLGTPFYLSPEQAAGRSKSIDRRADVYSLGVIMYELATGRLPFVGQTTVELYNRIIHDEPVPPSKVKPQLTKALETVVLKAMAKDPDDRYPTAAALGDDIQALLQGGTIAARPDGAVARGLKKLKKRGAVPLIVGASGLVLVTAVTAIVLVHRANVNRQQAQAVADDLGAFTRRVDEGMEAARARVEAGRLALEAERLPEALSAAIEALDRLSEVEQARAAVRHPENAGPADEGLAARADARRDLRAAALVLRARTSMLRDESDALARAQEDLTMVLEQVAPEDLDARIAQAELHLLAGKVPECLAKVGEALEREAGSLAAQQVRARALLVQQQLAEAIPVATQALEGLAAAPEPSGAAAEEAKARQARQRAGLLVVRATIYRELGELEKSRADAEAAVAALPGWWEALACHAGVLALQGEHFQARDRWAEAIAAAPEEAGPLCARAEGLLGLRAPAEALEDANAAVGRDTSALLALVLRAEAAEALLRHGDARRDAEAVVLRAHPRHWQVKARAERVLARIAAAREDWREALDRATTANAIDPYSAEGRLLLATVQLDPSHSGEYLDKADGWFKEVLRQRPASFEAKRGLALAAFLKDDRAPQAARGKLLEALRQDDRDPWTLAAMARVAEAAKEAEVARQARRDGARGERDVRRPEGHYFAWGLREDKRARRLAGEEQAAHVELARDAYQRALLHDPMHVQALNGLASIALAQRDLKRARAYLDRALAVHPRSSQALVLKARLLASRDQRDLQTARPLEALADALSARGETPELQALGALLTWKDQRADEDAAARLERTFQRFDALRVRDPWSLASHKLERELIETLLAPQGGGPRRPAPELDAVRPTLEARRDAVYARESKLARDMDERDQRAPQELAKVEELLRGGKAKEAQEAAHALARLAPWRADVWATLARARVRNGEAWGALAAGVRASYLDDEHARALFDLMRTASRYSDGDLDKEAERMVALDADALPFDPDLESMLRWAPHVTRALVARPNAEKGGQILAALEELVNHDPTLLTPQVFLGVLGYGADRAELALQHLLFVATVCEAGEAWYLAAVVVASQPNATRRDLVTAAEWLQQATLFNFRWSERAAAEKRLARLRESPVWARLLEAGGE